MQCILKRIFTIQRKISICRTENAQEKNVFLYKYINLTVFVTGNFYKSHFNHWRWNIHTRILIDVVLQNWLTDLEIFATLVAAIIHDYEHTGTTNNFHVMSGSDTALLYNDRAVLENHHISASFRWEASKINRFAVSNTECIHGCVCVFAGWWRTRSATFCRICRGTSSASFARSSLTWCWPPTCRFTFNRSRTWGISCLWPSQL